MAGGQYSSCMQFLTACTSSLPSEEVHIAQRLCGHWTVQYTVQCTVYSSVYCTWNSWISCEFHEIHWFWCQNHQNRRFWADLQICSTTSEVVLHSDWAECAFTDVGECAYSATVRKHPFWVFLAIPRVESLIAVVDCVLQQLLLLRKVAKAVYSYTVY